MGATLRVNPEVLRTAAAAQNEVKAFVSGLALGQSLTTAGTGMTGLSTEGACQLVGTTFDTAATSVHDDLSAHADNLTTAADRYHRTDETLGRGLRRIAP